MVTVVCKGCGVEFDYPQRPGARRTYCTECAARRHVLKSQASTRAAREAERERRDTAAEVWRLRRSIEEMRHTGCTAEERRILKAFVSDRKREQLLRLERVDRALAKLAS